MVLCLDIRLRPDIIEPLLAIHQEGVVSQLLLNGHKVRPLASHCSRHFRPRREAFINYSLGGQSQSK